MVQTIKRCDLRQIIDSKLKKEGFFLSEGI